MDNESSIRVEHVKVLQSDSHLLPSIFLRAFFGKNTSLLYKIVNYRNKFSKLFVEN